VETGARVPTVVLGGTGYVAGELLRILAGHPSLEPSLVVSGSQSKERVEGAFPHLRGLFGELRFVGASDLEGELAASRARGSRLAIFSAAPHGASAALVDRVLFLAEGLEFDAHVVDLSADFRYPSAAAYGDVYVEPHGAPLRLNQFSCALPEHVDGTPTRHVGHPGCFTTAVTLASVPLVALDLVDGSQRPRLTAVGVTGSTGSGRTPTAKTHHPERRSNLVAYAPFTHRHRHEMERLIEQRAGKPARVDFLPHSGPFARGIHVTLTARLATDASTASLAESFRSFYASAPFVDILDDPPALQSVVGTNRAAISVATSGDSVVVFSAIDNLTKGAAGGGVQWMNRLFGFPEDAGLRLPGLGWL
jgi:N-acetyl-gamma-glutamyl-phosphate reductase common form